MAPFLSENVVPPDLGRRGFLTSLVSLGVAASAGSLASAGAVPAGPMGPEPVGVPAGAKESPSGGKPIKLFCCDLNWVRLDKPIFGTPPATPQDWAFINPTDYFEWHKAFGVNVMFCQAYTFGGFAFYPTKLGPVAPGPGGDLFGTYILNYLISVRQETEPSSVC